MLRELFGTNDQTLVDNFLNHFDKDKNGIIDFDEFIDVLHN